MHTKLILLNGKNDVQAVDGNFGTFLLYVILFLLLLLTFELCSVPMLLCRLFLWVQRKLQEDPVKALHLSCSCHILVRLL